MTNYEKIKNMSIEEMVDIFGEYEVCNFCISDFTFCQLGCKENIKKYLESEAK